MCADVNGELEGELCTSSHDGISGALEKSDTQAHICLEAGDDFREFESYDIASVGCRLIGSKGTSHRPCPDTAALIPAGASVQLIRALRSLYDDDANACSRRQWLLQPVLRTSPSGTNSRPSSAGRLGGAPCAREALVLPRQSTRPSSARSSSSFVKVQTAEDVDHRRQPATIGRRAVNPVLTNSRGASLTEDFPHAQGSRAARPWSASGRQSGHYEDRSCSVASQQAALRTLVMLTELGEEREEARQLKQEKIRTWLQRKEAEVHERRLSEEAEARRNREEEERRRQQQSAQEAKMQKQKSCRLRAAARRKQEFVMEVQRAEALTAHTGKVATCNTFAGALAAYSTPRYSTPRPRSARSRIS